MCVCVCGRGGGRLFEGGDYFKYFRLAGDYSRVAINRGAAIILGNTVSAQSLLLLGLTSYI